MGARGRRIPLGMGVPAVGGRLARARPGRLSRPCPTPSGGAPGHGTGGARAARRSPPTPAGSGGMGVAGRRPTVGGPPCPRGRSRRHRRAWRALWPRRGCARHARSGVWLAMTAHASRPRTARPAPSAWRAHPSLWSRVSAACGRRRCPKAARGGALRGGPPPRRVPRGRAGGQRRWPRGTAASRAPSRAALGCPMGHGRRSARGEPRCSVRTVAGRGACGAAGLRRMGGSLPRGK
jgi:hypothetical protein